MLTAELQMSERQKVVLPAQPGDGLLAEVSKPGGAWWGGTANGDAAWHCTAPHTQPRRQALTVLCCCCPEQGQAPILGERDGEEGGLAERLARL